MTGKNLKLDLLDLRGKTRQNSENKQTFDSARKIEDKAQQNLRLEVPFDCVTVFFHYKS